MHESTSPAFAPTAPLAMANTQWYRCECRIGDVAVGVEVGAARLQQMQGTSQLLQQAMLLSEVELTLQAFEIWQGLDLDLVPVNEQSEIAALNAALSDDFIELEITHASLSDYLPTRFLFSKQAIHQLVAVDDVLTQSLKLQWSTLPLVISLDRFKLNEQELEKISVGASILLPASFEDAWQVEVKLPDVDGLSFTGSYDPVQKMLTIRSTSQAPEQSVGDESAPMQATVLLGNEILVSPAQLLGEINNETLELACGSGVLPAKISINGNPFAFGAVGQVGRGYAVHVTQMLLEN